MAYAATAIDFDYEDYRVEQLIQYNDIETVEVDTYVLFKSDETEDRIKQYNDLSVQMCFAGGGLKNETEMDDMLYVDGIAVK